MTTRDSARFGLIAALVCALPACSRAVEEVRRHTYAPSFEYVEKHHVREHMGRVTRDVARLNALLRRPSSALVGAERAEVVSLLGDLEAAVAELGSSERRTNHPLIDANRETFVREIQGARVAAEREPPDYFLAGSVAGACTHCHH